jgi:hypothetical protein
LLSDLAEPSAARYFQLRNNPCRIPAKKPRLDRRDFLECSHASTGSHFLGFGFTNSWQGQHTPFVRSLQFIEPASHLSCSTIQSEEVNIASHRLGRLKTTFAIFEIALYNALHVIAAVKSGCG